MEEGGVWFLRPGTLFLMMIMLVVGFGIVSWSSQDVFGDEPLQRQEQTIACSNVNLKFLDHTSNATHETVYIQVNKPVDAVLVNFEGDRNVTQVVDYGSAQRIVQVSARLNNLSGIEARVSGCERLFRQ